MKSTPFHQTNNYGCGSYALANLFNEKAFVDDIEEGAGQTINKLNRLLSVYHPEFILATFAQAHPDLPVFNRFDDIAIFVVNRSPEIQEFLFDHKRIWLCDVKRKRTHMLVLVQSLTEDVLWVVDSLHHEIYMTHIITFLTNNHVLGLHCLEHSVYHPQGEMGPGEVLFFKNSQLAHLID